MLFEIEIEGHAYVEAESEDDAITVFKRECSYSELHDLCDISAIPEPSALWGDWKNTEPYGSHDGKTVGELFDEKRMKDKAEKERKEYEAKHYQPLPIGG